jgi:hypothetical protein
MPVFEKQVLEELFGDLWDRMIKETKFGPKLKEKNLSIFFVITDPDVVMYIDSNGVIMGEEAGLKKPIVTMKMSGDNVHKFWLRNLNIPKALATRQVIAQGPVAKVLQLIPIMRPGMEMYPEYCKKYNLPMN